VTGLLLVALVGVGTSEAQEPPSAPPPLVIVIPEELLERLLPPPAPPAADDHHLIIPTTAYLATVGAEWLTAAARCAVPCSTVTRTLPTVSDPTLAVPFGLAIQASVLVLIHKVIAPRWPQAAEVLLYGLSALHGASAAHHVSDARRAVRGQTP